ncbi:uncharacterized protein LOC135338522 isoform X2 [Halichondria panicea]|uniref:uncharacterized protein LOC135338522 isoform X2 n=1 Tax=Halichondria panicea TaxID=6063 RepID=UPI00312B30A0
MSSGGFFTATGGGYAVTPGYQPVGFDSPPAYASNPSAPPPNGQPAPQYPGNQLPPYYYPQAPRGPPQQCAQYPQAGYVQQQSSNNVVVVQQSAAAFPVVVRPDGYQPEAGQAALVFAMIITIFSLIFGCWWSVVCSIPGIVFANSATSAGIHGNLEGVRSNNHLSYGCTIGAIVGAVVGVGAIVGLVFGLTTNRNTCYYNYYYCY